MEEFFKEIREHRDHSSMEWNGMVKNTTESKSPIFAMKKLDGIWLMVLSINFLFVMWNDTRKKIKKMQLFYGTINWQTNNSIANSKKQQTGGISVSMTTMSFSTSTFFNLILQTTRAMSFLSGNLWAFLPIHKLLCMVNASMVTVKCLV